MLEPMMKLLKRMLLAGVLIMFGLQTRTALAQTFSWTMSADQTAAQFNNTDAPPAMGLDSTGNFWYVYSDCNVRPHWHVWKGTSMDNLVEQSVFDTVSFPQPYGDDEYWISGMWIDPDTQTWYAVAHVEFDYNQWPPYSDYYLQHTNNADHFRRLVVTQSTDHGVHWSTPVDIITPHNPTVSTLANYPGTTFDFGDGDPHLYVDSARGYFYLFYMNKWVYKATGGQSGDESIMVARAPISGKMAWNTWTKWYNGTWTEAGRTGRETAITVGNTFAVTWNPYLGQYLAIDNLAPGCFYTCQDLSTQLWVQDWWNSTQIFAQTSGPSAISDYNWMVDTASTLNGATTSNCFRIYSANNNTKFATKYMWATLANTSFTPPLNNSHYYQIIDVNSGLALATASSASGAHVVQATPGNGYEQQWSFSYQGNGYYFVFNRTSGLVLDVAAPVLARGQNIIQAAINASACNQQWALEPTENGYYKLYNRNTRVIGMAGSNAVIYDEYFGAHDQEFSFVQK